MRTDYIHQGEALAFLKKLPNACVDLCMTSPPYWALRDYGVRGQLGLERTIEGYVRRLVRILTELKRVLKPSGSLYLSLGDSYVGSWGSASQWGGARRRLNSWPRPGYAHFVARPPTSYKQQVRRKSLAGVPWRVALRLIGQGWILRNAIVWHKPNGLPSSVKDRLSSQHEYLFHFVLSPRYYYHLDAIRVPHKRGTVTAERDFLRMMAGRRLFEGKWRRMNEDRSRQQRAFVAGHPLGRNPGDVWSIPTRPFKGAHFAVYPERLCERPILSSCPPGGVVLDPFAGSGTTLAVAKRLGRRWIGCELKRSYCDLARRRLGRLAAGETAQSNTPSRSGNVTIARAA
jgi:site-specific DNA-methyltransferase (cytosine-N4-specific)